MKGKDFLGCGLKFPLQVDPRTGRLAMVSAEEDIRESIGILINTLRGERVMRPNFGSDVLEYTFSAATSDKREGLAHHVEDVLNYQELRITDVQAHCLDNNGESEKILIEVSYRVRSTNNRYNHVYPFYLTEGSEGGGAV